MTTKSLHTDQDIAEINELMLKNLKPSTVIHSSFGPKHLKKIEFRGEANRLLDKNPDHCDKILIAIRDSVPQGKHKDRGLVKVDGHEYGWWFSYVDSTGFHLMPNGHRELTIAFSHEIED